MPRLETLSIQRATADDVAFAGTVVPRCITVQSLGLHDAPDMHATLELRDGVAACTSIVWHAKASGRPVTTSDLHEIQSLESLAIEAFTRYPRVIAEFRASDGRVGGQFAGAPILLLHHRDRHTDKVYVAPLYYLPDAQASDTLYVFATKAGALADPNWFHNLMAAGAATIEVGRDMWSVTVEEVRGEHRDRLYAEQASRFPGFAEYERLNAGVRRIPVVALMRTIAGSKGIARAPLSV